MFWWFTGCGHTIEGRIQEVEAHMHAVHAHGDSFTMEMRPYDQPEAAEPYDTFGYVVGTGTIVI